MTNLTSPVVSATSGLPKTNDMADVIDSLKRLERIGSENSKAIEKLMAAAEDLSRLIAKQFCPGEDERITVATLQRKTIIDSSLLSEWEENTRYMVHQSVLGAALFRDDTFVGKNRDTVLAFSKDIANGLLDQIIESLEGRVKETQNGLSRLEAAIDFMVPKFE